MSCHCYPANPECPSQARCKRSLLICYHPAGLRRTHDGLEVCWRCRNTRPREGPWLPAVRHVHPSGRMTWEDGELLTLDWLRPVPALVPPP